MKCPAQSPDLNLIENLWKILDNIVMAEKPTTVTELWKRVEEEWTKITAAQCEKLVMFGSTDVLKSVKAIPTHF